MLPVLLEMTGFGSFRESTTVDFTDADFFALIGPTGAGKSTVIDAIVFALYGSVPRWDDRKKVSLALSPTLNRGVVRLVFDLGAERYIAVRELRRSPTYVGIRHGRLERLIDPTRLGTTDDETELIAADRNVNAAVEKLLGLSFKHFCSCVVLPQGAFAEFLRAKPSERQEILTQLLGLGVYTDIAKRANVQASAAEQRATVIDEQIGRLAGATQDAEDAASVRVQQLTELNDYVTAVLPQLAAAVKTVEDAQREVSRIDSERARLSALTVPAGVAALTERLIAARDAAQKASSELAAAEQSDDTARQTLAAAPARGPLEQARRDHAEHATLAGRVPDAERRRHDAAAALSTATAGYNRIAHDLTTADAAAATAAAAAAAADGRVAALRSAHTALTGLVAPPGIADLGDLEHATMNTFAAASKSRAEAELAETNARHQLDAAPARSTLERAQRDHITLAGLLASQPDLDRQLAHAHRQVEAAGKAHDDAQHAAAQARIDRDDAARLDAAAALRPHLVTGQPCPVCGHSVDVLPAPLDNPSLAAADLALKNAEKGLRTAYERHLAAAGTEQEARTAVETAAAAAAQLRATLTGDLADPNQVDAGLGRLDELSTAFHQAAARLRQARADEDAARTAVDTAKKRLATERTTLNAARDPLVPLGAPPIDTLDLASAWTALLAWAHAEAATRGELLTNAVAEADAATTSAERHAKDLARVRADLATANTLKETATRIDQQAETELQQLRRRLTELADVLAEAPDDAAAAAELDRIGELEAAVAAAHDRLRTTRAGHKAAATKLTAVQKQEQNAWKDLRTARDPLVPLGAPTLDEKDLLAGWTDLHAWSTAQSQDREQALGTAAAHLAKAGHEQADIEHGLANRLHDAEIAVPAGSEIINTVAAVAARALERACGHLDKIQDQRQELAELHTAKAAAETEQQVARMLAHLLRSDEFPRWLIAAALDVLVEDASASLAELSGGQFDLTHNDGQFMIIDHTNADLPRPVTTLSGGETFQASLALALALSAQIKTLAAAGSVRLDSIFLDEGFGTLDEATLDTVATTLETLASQGDRMVGVVSHVNALAERVPVKFRVRRDQFGSAITRDES